MAIPSEIGSRDEKLFLGDRNGSFVEPFFCWMTPLLLKLALTGKKTRVCVFHWRYRISKSMIGGRS
jgi:hypothetical protein